MPISTFSSVFVNTTVEQMRAWIAPILTAMDAPGGLVRTVDTGQINVATVAKPGLGAEAGYAMWRTDDGLAPLFIRLSFGSSFSGANNARISLSVGTGTDGAGNLTGVLIPAVIVGNGTNATAFNSFICTKPYGFVLSGSENQTTASERLLWVVERSINAAGAYTADGVWAVYAAGVTGASQVNRYATWAGATTGTENYLQSVGSMNPSLIGGNVAASPIFPVYGGPMNPSRMLIAYRSTEVGLGAIETISPYGIAGQYRFEESTRAPAAGSGTAMRLAYLYEA